MSTGPRVLALPDWQKADKDVAEELMLSLDFGDNCLEQTRTQILLVIALNQNSSDSWEIEQLVRGIAEQLARLDRDWGELRRLLAGSDWWNVSAIPSWGSRRQNLLDLEPPVGFEDRFVDSLNWSPNFLWNRPYLLRREVAREFADGWKTEGTLQEISMREGVLSVEEQRLLPRGGLGRYPSHLRYAREANMRWIAALEIVLYLKQAAASGAAIPESLDELPEDLKARLAPFMPLLSYEKLGDDRVAINNIYPQVSEDWARRIQVNLVTLAP
ncbi:MAG: hypothetical protein WC423_20750 [Vulcanimicrobiota bacterium]